MNAPDEPLYDALIRLGIPTDNHESDLYFPVTVESGKLLCLYPEESKSASTFTNQREGGRWYEVPFAFLPWWRARA